MNKINQVWPLKNDRWREFCSRAIRNNEVIHLGLLISIRCSILSMYGYYFVYILYILFDYIIWSGSQNTTLQWRHNECNCISNHRPLDGLLNHLFRRRSKKTSKLHIWPKAMRGLECDSVSCQRFCVGRHIKLCGTEQNIRNSEEFSNWKTLGGLPHQTNDTCSQISLSREAGTLPSSQMVPNQILPYFFCCWASKLCEIPEVAHRRVPEWSGRMVSVWVHDRPSSLPTQIWQLECCVRSVWGTDLHMPG